MTGICVLGGAICGDPLGVFVATLIVSALFAIVAVPTIFIFVAWIRRK